MNLAFEVQNLTKKFKDRIVINGLNLNVKKGETIGVIGSNGSGKSTFIRILSGIIKPTDGSVRVNGTVTSILEVGNGFHPDLTGRENCYMTVRLKGFSDKQISERINNIIEFSELGESFDYPIKHYSNGMYLRLAFAIFEQFNSDILLLDEVLSVGDAAFREKIAKVIRKFKAEGRTIIMVSHNMSEVINFCDRVLYFSKNQIVDSTEIRDVIDNYLLKSRNNQITLDSEKEVDLLTIETSQKQPLKNDLLQISSIQFGDNQINQFCFHYSKGVDIHISYTLFRESKNVHFIIKIYDLSGNLILTSSTAFNEFPINEVKTSGNYSMKIRIPANMINKGVYNITLLVAEDNELNAYWDDVASFKIVHDDWMKNRPWSTTPTPILINLPTSIERLN